MIGPDEDISWVSEGFDRRWPRTSPWTSAPRTTSSCSGVTYDIFVPYRPHAVPYDEGWR